MSSHCSCPTHSDAHIVMPRSSWKNHRVWDKILPGNVTAATTSASSLLAHFIESLYLVMEVSDSNDHQNTMGLQTVLVVNMSSSVVLCTRMLTSSCPSNVLEEPSAGSVWDLVEKPFFETMDQASNLNGWSLYAVRDGVRIFQNEQSAYRFKGACVSSR